MPTTSDHEGLGSVNRAGRLRNTTAAATAQTETSSTITTSMSTTQASDRVTMPAR